MGFTRESCICWPAHSTYQPQARAVSSDLGKIPGGKIPGGKSFRCQIPAVCLHVSCGDIIFGVL